jgi:hypothetical protein
MEISMHLPMILMSNPTQDSQEFVSPVTAIVSKSTLIAPQPFDGSLLSGETESDSDFGSDLIGQGLELDR